MQFKTRLISSESLFQSRGALSAKASSPFTSTCEIRLYSPSNAGDKKYAPPKNKINSSAGARPNRRRQSNT